MTPVAAADGVDQVNNFIEYLELRQLKLYTIIDVLRPTLASDGTDRDHNLIERS